MCDREIEQRMEGILKAIEELPSVQFGGEMVRPLKTRVEIGIVEWAGNKLAPGDSKELILRSHWNRGELIVISIKIATGDIEFSVSAADLSEAIGRCRY